jgi:hypothetical protein
MTSLCYANDSISTDSKSAISDALHSFSSEVELAIVVSQQYKIIASAVTFGEFNTCVLTHGL